MDNGKAGAKMGSRDFRRWDFRLNRRETRAIAVWLSLISIIASLGAAPAPKSHQSVERKLAEIQKSAQSSAKDGDTTWAKFAEALKSEFQRFSEAQDASKREASLQRLEQFLQTLEGIAWPPAAELRAELASWLAPRAAFAQARGRFLNSLGYLNPSAGFAPDLGANRGWADFLEKGIDKPLFDYEAAQTVEAKIKAQAVLRQAAHQLRDTVMANPWSPGFDLLYAFENLVKGSNVRATADLQVMTLALENNLVTDGPVERKGQIAFVTAGPKTGFGLLFDDDGITFYNKQLLSSVTNVRGFEEQVSENRGGQILTRLYTPALTTFNKSELAIFGRFTTEGLSLWSDAMDKVDIKVCTHPKNHSLLGRAALALAGQDQQRLTQRIYDGAIGRVREEVPRESREERNERLTVEEAKQNERLREYLVGGRTIVYDNYAATRVRLLSQPDGALLSSLIQWRGLPAPAGADAPPPLSWGIEPGLVIDAHAPSILNNLYEGALTLPDVKSAENLFIDSGEPPSASRLKVERNVSQAEFEKRVAAFQRELKTNPGSQRVIARLQRPKTAPVIGIDDQGRIAAIIRNFIVEVVPTAEMRERMAQRPFRTTADYLRIEITRAELIVTATPKVDPSANAIGARGKIDDFDPGARVRISTVLVGKPPAPLSRFLSGTILRMGVGEIKGRTFDTPPRPLTLRGFRLNKVTPIDPSGWVRVQLAPTGEKLLPGNDSSPGMSASSSDSSSYSIAPPAPVDAAPVVLPDAAPIPITVTEPFAPYAPIR